MFLTEAVAAITGAMNELQVDPGAVEQTHSALQSVLKTLRDDPFDYMATIQRESFGGNDPATDLSYHHGRAHDVMAATKRGIESDIIAFAENLLEAARIIAEVDDAIAVDLKRKQALAEAFHYLDQNSQADAAHDHSRNDVKNPWSDDGESR